MKIVRPYEPQILWALALNRDVQSRPIGGRRAFSRSHSRFHRSELRAEIVGQMAAINSSDYLAWARPYQRLLVELAISDFPMHLLLPALSWRKSWAVRGPWSKYYTRENSLAPWSSPALRALIWSTDWLPCLDCLQVNLKLDIACRSRSDYSYRWWAWAV